MAAVLKLKFGRVSMLSLDREKLKLAVFITFLILIFSFFTINYQLLSNDKHLERTNASRKRRAVASYVNIDPLDYPDPYLTNYLVLLSQLKKYHPGADFDYLLLYSRKGSPSTENGELPPRLKTVFASLNVTPIMVPEEEGTPIWWFYQMNVQGHDGYKRAIGDIYLWTLDYYDKIIFLNADMVIKSEIIHSVFALSEGHEFSAVPDPHMGLIAQVPYGAQNYFNTGVLSLKPSQKVYENMQSFFGNSTGQLANLLEWDRGYADQDFLNFYFGASWHHLPAKYDLIHISQWPKNVLESSVVYHDKIWKPEVLELLPKAVKDNYMKEYEIAQKMLKS